MRGLLRLEEADLETVLREVEAVCAVREYLAARSLLAALRSLKSRLPPEVVVRELELLLQAAADAAAHDLERYGPALSTVATVVDWEARIALQREDRRASGQAGGQG